MVGRLHVGRQLRTVVISDLHLGSRGESDLLRCAAGARARLLDQLEGCRRLVLLGDLLELRHDPIGPVIEAAEPVLAQLGGALGAQGEVILVPGNHDHRLLASWRERRYLQDDPAPLGLQSVVQWREDDPLARVARALAPAEVKAFYPGVWLRQDVYATHGHYADRHITVPIMERVGAGVMTRLVSEPRGGPARAEDYEAVLAPLYDWIDSVAQSGLRGSGGGRLQVLAWHALQRRRGQRVGLAASIRNGALRAVFRVAVGGLNLAGIGPLGSDVSPEELRRASLRAMAEILDRLGVRARHVVFGHTHRAGPLPGDEEREWLFPGGELVNSGCWVSGDTFMDGRPRTSPYRPGFCVVIEDRLPPALVNLLDQKVARPAPV